MRFLHYIQPTATTTSIFVAVLATVDSCPGRSIAKNSQHTTHLPGRLFYKKVL